MNNIDILAKGGCHFETEILLLGHTNLCILMYDFIETIDFAQIITVLTYVGEHHSISVFPPLWRSET